MGWPKSCPNPDSIYDLSLERNNKSYKISFRWGDARVFGTAAYWISQYLILYGKSIFKNYNIGSNLFEETIACLLGGHGVPAELGLAAFHMLKIDGLTSIDSDVSLFTLENTLNKPIQIGRKQFKYRFPRQRAIRLMDAFKYFRKNPHSPSDPHGLREWLLKINGIGMKTASWIVRNHTAFPDIAIIDIHIHKAGITSGFLAKQWKLPYDYELMEQAFIGFAKAGGVPASGLDALIWSQMRILKSCNFVNKDGRVRLFSKTDKSVSISQLFP